MIVQTTFADVEADSRRRATRRDEFLAQMERAVPWAEIVAVVEPFYPKGERGRRPVPLERMLRMYMLQLWFNLSDEGCEDAVYDSRAFSRFVGVSFGAGDQVPDATTLLKFRHLMEEHSLGQRVLAEVNRVLEERGVVMRGGSVVDATIVAAPSSTKNASGKRDPEMHQAKKGNQWHFGMKAHIGADAGSGIVHTVSCTAANVSDVTVAARLVRPDDEVAYADSGYTGVARRPEVAGDGALSKIEWRVAEKPSKLKGAPEWSADREAESRKASVRSKVEHPFLIVKRQFGWSKCRYRGIAKNENAFSMLFALADVAMWARAGCPVLPAESPA
ncbi:MAG: IS5 family transposase [Coriobacteriales bacterium]